MTLLLGISCVESDEHYAIDDGFALEHAIKQEAAVMAADAGSDLIEDPSDATRATFERLLVERMEGVLRRAGDRWKAPDGVVYWLYEN